MYYSMLHTVDNELICVACRTIVEEGEDEYSFEGIDEMYTFDVDSTQLGYYNNPADITYSTETSGLGIDQYNNFKAALRDFFNEMLEITLYNHDNYDREMITRVFEKKFYSIQALRKLLDKLK